MNTADYWEGRYAKGGDSGAGSRGDAAKWKAKRVNKWAGKEVLDIGCGDGYMSSMYKIPLYTGIDPSPSAILHAAAMYGTDDRYFFTMGKGIWDPCHTHMSIDVMYHLVDDQAFVDHLETLFNAKKRVIVYASDFDSEPGEYAPHVRHRQWGHLPSPTIWELVHSEEGPAETPCNFYVFDRL